MSWFSNPFKSLHYSDGDDDDQPQNDTSSHGGEDTVTGGGVNDDLSAIGLSISRQLRGVAAFLAPPPDEEANFSYSAGDGDGDGGDRTFAGIKNDLAEIGGTFKNSLSLFSSPNKAVSRISELASNFLQFNEGNSENFSDYRVDRRKSGEYSDDEYGEEGDEEEEEEEEYGVGVTDQVIEFARQISDRPELWLDFPLSLHHEFDMSDAQSEHVSVVEQLVPSLADLRSRISRDKSDKQFWMIYFILLLPRLNDDDLELLATPEIFEAREKLLLMLRSKNNEENLSESSQLPRQSELDHEVTAAEPERSQYVGEIMTAENTTALRNTGSKVSDATEKLAGADNVYITASTESYQTHAKIDEPDSSIFQSNEAADASNVGPVNKATDNVDHLKQEEEKEPVPSRSSATASRTFQSEDDVSFSDLEEDNDLPSKQSGSGPSQLRRNSSTEGSTDWVRLNKNDGTGDSHLSRGQASSCDRDSEGEESVDWLTVDDFDA